MSDIDLTEQDEALNLDTEKGNFSYPENYEFDAGVGSARTPSASSPTSKTRTSGCASSA